MTSGATGRILAIMTVVGLLAAACGGSGASTESQGAPAEGGSTASAAGSTDGGSGGEVLVGLITKTDTNPFFVKMREGAEAAAEEQGAEVQSFAGEFDGDNQSQVQAIETLIQAEADGILITPSDSSAIVPAIQQARDAGIVVIALDTPTEPEDAVDATFATDNLRAGELIGEYAAAKFEESGEEPRIAMLDLAEGVSVGVLRHDGFLAGFGIEEGAEEIVGSEFTAGDQAQGRTAMENLLQRDPEINLVYTINEPAARGAFEAIEAVGRADEVMVVSIDGSCPGVEDVQAGRLAATSMQFPLDMAALGVEAIVNHAQSGEEVPSGFTDTGVQLITDDPVEGLEAQDAAWGADNCWG